jgi:homoserine kinase type II
MLQKIKNVYILFHINKLNDEDSKIVGVYSSKENAQKAKKKMKTLPGFKDSPNSFILDRYELDKEYWSDGFITVK